MDLDIDFIKMMIIHMARHINWENLCGARVVDPYSFFPDPDPEVDVRGQYGSGSKSGSGSGSTTLCGASLKLNLKHNLLTLSLKTDRLDIQYFPVLRIDSNPDLPDPHVFVPPRSGSGSDWMHQSEVWIRIRIHRKMSLIRNTGIFKHAFYLRSLDPDPDPPQNVIDP